jgi:hypothetical protein
MTVLRISVLCCGLRLTVAEADAEAEAELEEGLDEPEPRVEEDGAVFVWVDLPLVLIVDSPLTRFGELSTLELPCPLVCDVVEGWASLRLGDDDGLAFMSAGEAPVAALVS